MKELIKGIVVFIFAFAFTLPMVIIGIPYTIIKIIKKSINKKDILLPLKFIWKFIDGYAAAFGHFLFETAYSLDETWNVNGEIIEDIVTKEDCTEFGKKNTPVSASIGKLELENKLTKHGKNVSKFLNFIFWEKNHAIDSWNFLIAKKELKKQFFQKKGKFRIVIEDGDE